MTGFHSPHPLYSLSTLSLLSLITLARTLSLFPLFLGPHQDFSSRDAAANGSVVALFVLCATTEGQPSLRLATRSGHAPACISHLSILTYTLFVLCATTEALHCIETRRSSSQLYARSSLIHPRSSHWFRVIPVNYIKSLA